MSAHPWKCSSCKAVVFIPEDAGITGGVCTQQRLGCEGEIVRMEPAEADHARRLIPAGVSEQPWLTLVFSARAT